MKQKIDIIGSAVCGVVLTAACASAQTQEGGCRYLPECNCMQCKCVAGGATGISASENPQFPHWSQKESLFLADTAGDFAEKTGFEPFAVWTGEQWSNVSGGVETGTDWDSLFTFGFEQDFEPLTKISGVGSFGISAFYYTRTGDFSGGKVGAASDPSNIFSGEMLRIFEIYYRNDFDVAFGNIGFRIGQLAADEDFMGMDYADIFLNSNFGAIPINAGDSLANGAVAFLQYSLAVAGLTFYANIGDFDAIVGLYNGNCGDDVSSNNGFDYKLQSVAFWYQLGYNYDLAGLGGRVIFGENWHGGDFVDWKTGGIKSGFHSFYLGLQQDFIADGEGNPILGGFVRLAWAPDTDVASYTKYVDFGLNWFGPIPERADDVFAIEFSGMESGGAYRSAEGAGRFDTMAEATYRCRIIPAIAFQPAFQLYFNTKDANGETRAYVVGARLEVIFKKNIYEKR